MSSPISLPDLLGVLPDDARARILGGRFSRTHAGCRLACQALRQLHDSSVTHANLLLNDSNAVAWQQGLVRSPLLRMSACSSLELYLQHDRCLQHTPPDRPVSLALVGATAAARQRITRLKVKFGDKRDIERLVEALAARLPALEELEFIMPVDNVPGAVARTQLIMCTIADFLPRLRRLVLPLPPDATAPAGLGALAACAQLRELTMCAFGGCERLGLTMAAFEGLTQLQQLEHLTLDRFRLRAGDEELVTQLLTTHRPPNLLTLKLLQQYSLPFLEVDFERAAGAGAQPEGRRGMRCVALKYSPIGDCAMQCADQVARAVLAAADRLQQLTVPELAFGRLWLSEEWRPPRYVQPGDPLPRLLARCGRVKLGSLFVGYSMPEDARDPAPVLAVVRLMGLPRSLELAHGEWQPHAQAVAQELGSCGAPVGAAEPGGGQPAGGPAAPPAQVERRQTRQVARLQRQLQQGLRPQQLQQGLRPQQLQLDSATPEQVLAMAVEELAAEAAQAGAARGCGGGAGGGAAGGRLVLLRGALPPRGARPAAVGEEPGRGWGTADCRRAAGLGSAAELAALLSPGAAAASSAQRRGEAGSARAATAVVIQEQTNDAFAAETALCSRILQVLTGMWARSQQGGGGSGGTGANPGGSSSASSNREVADEEALRQLLALDLGVRRLWASVWKPVLAEIRQ
ncbi:hypothetical protein HXX76_015937 [Chlamydomonas incerta]|uniref:Uncharacterized protein n=1 Tax=Chlamydomonas incerta TaxID=51695 RepID=A0A835S877_CHLIN|nr:hypothetical protein HXX76_015937 [Chlamydomonas incerta]|eukprot:KAG2422557.1 hypothetical protein HXX76_015937 [Chlamydomonas incerta]